MANLLDDELIYESQIDHNPVGRRTIMLSINGQAGYVKGIDLDYHQIQYTVSDLRGCPVDLDTFQIETNDYHTIVQQLIKQINIYRIK